MTTNIEQDIIDDAKAAGFDFSDKGTILAPYNNENSKGYFIVEDELVKFAKLTRERQASGEAVAWAEVVNGEIIGRDNEPNVAWENIDVYQTPLYIVPQQAYIPDGWQLVPIEPTDEMTKKAAEHYETSEYTGIRSTYKIMLSAIPTAPIESVKELK